jgi:hypothetical protein
MTTRSCSGSAQYQTGYRNSGTTEIAADRLQLNVIFMVRGEALNKGKID